MAQSPAHLETGRVLWVAALTLLLAELAVQAIRMAAILALHPAARFMPLTPLPPLIDTFIGAVGAVVVFACFAEHENPVRKYRRVAAVVLALSFLPDVLLAVSHNMGGGWPEACALMLMHVAVWAICVTLLPGLAFSKRSQVAEKSSQPLSIL